MVDIRAQVSMVFNADKCIGCHTCSLACKNVWTDREGTEYMWWNNVETKPGTGYPTLWEDQTEYRGGWEIKDNKVNLKLQSKLGTFKNLFFNSHLPTIDDYYHPWTYDYQNLFNAPESNEQPAARPISLINGKPMEIKMGPNWDDDLGGSNIYAKNDVNLEGLSEIERAQLQEVERVVFFYLPRICNHCLNPGCVAACPSGALYKRGEDGIVLVNQDKCRGWRMCVSACPYKKVYYNWKTGKSEKCILCYPRLETGQAPACFHSCVGRIRYLGLVLYDADEIQQTVNVPNNQIVQNHLKIIKDPFDPNVIEAAKACGLSDEIIASAQKSPVFRFVKEWGIALPLHPEFRTLPMLFYVPPLLPLLGNQKNGIYEIFNSGMKEQFPQFTDFEQFRIPLKFIANMFSAGNIDIVKEVYKKLMAVRSYMHSSKVNDSLDDHVKDMLKRASMTEENAKDIWYLTSLATIEDRFVIPPMYREIGVELLQGNNPFKERSETGFGYREPPKRSW